MPRLNNTFLFVSFWKAKKKALPARLKQNTIQQKGDHPTQVVAFSAYYILDLYRLSDTLNDLISKKRLFGWRNFYKLANENEQRKSE